MLEREEALGGLGRPACGGPQRGPQSWTCWPGESEAPPLLGCASKSTTNLLVFFFFFVKSSAFSCYFFVFFCFGEKDEQKAKAIAMFLYCSNKKYLRSCIRKHILYTSCHVVFGNQMYFLFVLLKIHIILGFRELFFSIKP